MRRTTTKEKPITHTSHHHHHPQHDWTRKDTPVWPLVLALSDLVVVAVVVVVLSSLHFPWVARNKDSVSWSDADVKRFL